LSCLGLAGFPITPTFIGIDLLFTHIHEDQWLLVLLTGLNFLFLELTLLRVYIRIFLGQHKKAYHPVAFRSS
jgi:NADH-quinone oxidoreductase subunit L